MPAGLRESDDSHFIAHFLAGAEETFAIVSVGSLCENLAVEIKKRGRMWRSLIFTHSSFSHPLLPCTLPPSVGVWYTKCCVIAGAVRRREQPSAKCPCFPEWFFWRCFGRVAEESAV